MLVILSCMAKHEALGSDGYFAPANFEEAVAIGGIVVLSETQWIAIHGKDNSKAPEEDMSEKVEKLLIDFERERIMNEGYFSD
jgi:hypothetical protein